MATDPICGMKVDESSGIKLVWQDKAYYFCSDHCRDKFIKKNNISAPDVCSGCETPKGAAFWQNKIFILSIIYLFIFTLGNISALIEPLSISLMMYLRTVIFAIFIGILIGGIIDWLIPNEYISILLAQKKESTILYAVITGFFMSACSHGILALSIQLYKKGASPPAVVAFLLASPWANLPLTILMFGFFGAKAFLIVGSAVVIALITGYIFMYLESRSLIERNPNTISVEKDFSIIKDAKNRIKNIKIGITSTLNGLRSIWKGMVSLSNMVLWWIMIGMLLASIAAAYLPKGFMQEYMGPTVLGLLVTLLLATIMEICSEGTAPMAFEIFRQTGAFGNSFIFLMAGVVTDYTEIGLLWTNIGKRTAIWMPIIAVPQSVLLGILFNIYIK